jgi:hypothetical protein
MHACLATAALVALAITALVWPLGGTADAAGEMQPVVVPETTVRYVRARAESQRRLLSPRRRHRLAPAQQTLQLVRASSIWAIICE